MRERAHLAGVARHAGQLDLDRVADVLETRWAGKAGSSRWNAQSVADGTSNA